MFINKLLALFLWFGMESALLNKEVKVLYDDGRSIVIKTGILINILSDWIELDINSSVEILMKQRIVRIEKNFKTK